MPRRRSQAHLHGGSYRPGPAGLVAVALVLLLVSGVMAWRALGPAPFPGEVPDPAPPRPAPEDAGNGKQPGEDEPAPGPESPRSPAPGSAGGQDGGAPGGNAGSSGAGATWRLETVATGLEVPWDMAFDRRGRLFFTERPGRINLLDGGRVVTLATLPDTVATGESGLLGIALHPGFPDPPYLYVYQTYRTRGGQLRNRILRFGVEEGGGSGAAGAAPRLAGRQVVFDGIPAAAIHDGGQLEFGPDGKLYVTTGDARQPQRAQDPESLHGKILRLNPDGSVPPDNPLGPGNPVFSYGHRNPEGLAFDPASGRLYAVEHGPDAWDEVNRIEAGANYGWPVAVAPGEHRGRFTPALRSYDPIIAPAGAAFYRGPIRAWDGSLFFGTLGFQPDSPGRHLHRLRLDASGTRVVEEEILFKGQFGRIRAVQTGPGGCLYFGTSNRDGRGEPDPLDDRILRLCPQAGSD
ncbi:PQQ-dependent sugar dehydrogenase [Thermaerobacter subterraneus]|uniref:Glucose/sorbosone dehydrogenase n=1 Tax=Thermaerobacter subterraneus DSM 13965 TaxID=867903 RepID=K6QC71_9FIRM|nr:PQQ-dependent sugar dehydrogenase [Thermaerobacter subterraneus]EKP94046.1 glucose/sorbosone dehydrogenase [Thermaerobacter subterraneus DSM 13965]